jgi:hypothetical protein
MDFIAIFFEFLMCFIVDYRQLFHLKEVSVSDFLKMLSAQTLNQEFLLTILWLLQEAVQKVT